MNQSRFQLHRPLVGGIAIYNPNAVHQGTLGFIGLADDGSPWIVSCYHVLCRFQGDFPTTAVEDIFQPNVTFPPGIQLIPIARVSSFRIDKGLDIAAARVINVGVHGRIYGLGKLANFLALNPLNRRVLKSGAQTDVTEGIVSSVTSQEIQISSTQDHDLSGPGDSGSLWVDAETLAPVALHTGIVGGDTATARPIQLVLDTLGLRIAPFS